MADAGALGPGAVAVAAAEAGINGEQAAAMGAAPRDFFFQILFSYAPNIILGQNIAPEAKRGRSGYSSSGVAASSSPKRCAAACAPSMMLSAMAAGNPGGITCRATAR